MSTCHNCGDTIDDKKKIGVNGRDYCLKKECIDSAFKRAVEPIKHIAKILGGEQCQSVKKNSLYVARR